MKTKVLKYTKCLKCGNINTSIMRDDTINSDLTDKDIHLLIETSCEPQNRVRVSWCEKCKMHTKQEDVGWDHIVEEEKVQDV